MTTIAIRKLNNFYIGDSFAIQFEFRDDEYQFIDISNWKLYMTFKNHRNDSDKDAELQLLFTIPDNTTGGKYIMFIPGELTNRFSVGRKYWDIQLVIGETPNKIVQTIGYGENFIDEDITRSY